MAPKDTLSSLRKEGFFVCFGPNLSGKLYAFFYSAFYMDVIVSDIFLAFPASPNLKVSQHRYFPVAMFSAYVSEITKTIEL